MQLYFVYLVSKGKKVVVGGVGIIVRSPHTNCINPDLRLAQSGYAPS